LNLRYPGTEKVILNSESALHRSPPSPAALERLFERAFHSLKTTDLDIRPIHHRRARRGRGHVLLCMLAYYVTWHMQQALAPMLFTDYDKRAAALQHTSPVTTARVSPATRAKAATKRSVDGQPVHSFATLLSDLANLTRNTIRFGDALPVTVLSRPTTVQQRAFQLLSLKHDV
jgi:hypothetical protein